MVMGCISYYSPHLSWSFVLRLWFHLFYLFCSVASRRVVCSLEHCCGIAVALPLVVPTTNRLPTPSPCFRLYFSPYRYN